MRKLSSYPILHHFLARLYEDLNIFEVEDMLAFIVDDRVSSYCKCKDKGCASFFMHSDRELDLSKDDGVYIYDSDKGMIVLEFFENGDIDVQALEYEDYPFKEELISVYNQEEPLDYALENDANEELLQKIQDDAKKIVSKYFNVEQNEVPIITVE